MSRNASDKAAVGASMAPIFRVRVATAGVHHLGLKIIVMGETMNHGTAHRHVHCGELT
jgi:hypothetical protein